MGVKLSREKKRHLLLSVLYRLQKFIPIRREQKFKLFLDLEWIFDRLSNELSFELYSVDDHPVRKYSRKFILNDIKSEDLVLDLGCKYGDIAFFIASKAKNVIGIDYDEEAILIARERYKKSNLKFEIGEALSYITSLPYKFDVLVLSHILEHLDDPELFLQRFKAHFDRIYIEVPDFDKTYLNHYRKDYSLNLLYTDNDHVSEFDRVELKELLRKCNLSILREEYIFGVQKIWCKV